MTSHALKEGLSRRCEELVFASFDGYWSVTCVFYFVLLFPLLPHEQDDLAVEEDLW